jgi:hypothetical protein
LVGGTALSLRFGHRKSDDLDLFSNESFDNDAIVKELSTQFGGACQFRNTIPGIGIFGFINEVKIDLVYYPHPCIRPIVTIDGIRMYADEDIMAMKVQALLGRGKKKDFWDIAELLEHYTVDDFVRFHKAKFSTQNLMITVPQALTYFADAEDGEDPISLKNQTWETVKTVISSKVSAYLQ